VAIRAGATRRGRGVGIVNLPLPFVIIDKVYKNEVPQNIK